MAPDQTILETLANLLETTLGLPMWLSLLIAWLLGVVVLGGAILTAGGMLSWLMRKLMARVHQRIGPNRVGPFGLLQFLADGLKLIAKEDITPARADRWGFKLAPYILLIPIILAFAPLPFGPGVLVADLRVGLLFILAISAAAPVGEILAGWSSNNKYSMMGALRAAAMDVSYEIPLILSAIAVVILAGSLNTQDIVEAQRGLWFIALQPLGAFIFFAGALAKAGVVPMDLPEAESELVAGFFTEYSGMRYGIMFVGVFVNIILISALTVLLFFGGWTMPGMGAWYLPEWTGVIWFLLKVFLFVSFVIIIWFTVPRIRIDQFLSVGWKALFPLSLLNLVIAVAEVYYLNGGFA